MKTVAIIPARAGSKRIPNKNLAELNGYPLLEWSIRAARSVGIINEIIVSTNGKEIKKLSESLGATVIDRPPGLCTDTATSESAIMHVLDNMSEKPDVIVFFECTSPFQRTDDIHEGIVRLTGNNDSVLMVHAAPLFIWNGEHESITYDWKNRVRTQEMVRYFIECSVFFFTYDLFQKTGNRLGGTIGFQNTWKFASMDIDEPEDLVIANAMAQAYNLKPEGIE